MLKYKHNRKLINLKCDYCGKEYDKPISEYNRNKFHHRHSFCSRSCATSFGNRLSKNRSHEHLKNFQRKSNPFLYYIKLVKQRFKYFDVTLNDLEEQWNLQKGICPYSGINLLLASHSKTHIDPIYRASLDRIDSSKGYIKGNIQFISTCINYMKNTISHEDTIKLCKLISKNYICTLMQDWTISSSTNVEMDALAGN